MTVDTNKQKSRITRRLRCSHPQIRHAKQMIKAPVLLFIVYHPLKSRISRKSKIHLSKAKGTSKVTTASGVEYVTKHFGKIIPGRNTILFDTKTHCQIISILLGHADALSRGVYENHSGTSSSMVVGAKGIGKTERFLNFMQLANAVVANVIVVYVDFSGVSSTILFFQRVAVSDVMSRGEKVRRSSHFFGS